MTIFIILLSLVAGYLLAQYGRLRWFRRAPCYVLVYDGSARAYKGVRVPGGVQVTTDAGPIVYPESVVSKVAIDGNPALPLYLVAAAPIPLAEHEALETGRMGIAFSEMFKPESRWINVLRAGAFIAPIVAALWLTLSFSTVSSTLTSNTADLKLVRQAIEKVTQDVGKLQPTIAPSE